MLRRIGFNVQGGYGVGYPQLMNEIKRSATQLKEVFQYYDIPCDGSSIEEIKSNLTKWGFDTGSSDDWIDLNRNITAQWLNVARLQESTASQHAIRPDVAIGFLFFERILKKHGQTIDMSTCLTNDTRGTIEKLKMIGYNTRNHKGYVGLMHNMKSVHYVKSNELATRLRKRTGQNLRKQMSALVQSMKRENRQNLGLK